MARSAHLCVQVNLENSSLATRGVRKTTHTHTVAVCYGHAERGAFFQFILGKEMGSAATLWFQ